MTFGASEDRARQLAALHRRRRVSSSGSQTSWAASDSSMSLYGVQLKSPTAPISEDVREPPLLSHIHQPYHNKGLHHNRVVSLPLTGFSDAQRHQQLAHLHGDQAERLTQALYGSTPAVYNATPTLEIASNSTPQEVNAMSSIVALVLAEAVNRIHPPQAMPTRMGHGSRASVSGILADLQANISPASQSNNMPEDPSIGGQSPLDPIGAGNYAQVTSKPPDQNIQHNVHRTFSSPNLRGGGGRNYRSPYAGSPGSNGWGHGSYIPVHNRYHPFYSTGGAPVVSTGSRSSLVKIFDKYREDIANSPDTVGMEGTMQYLQDIDVDVEGLDFLVVSEIIQAPSMGEMSRDGFVDGWAVLNCDTIDKQKNHVKSLKQSLPSNKTLFTKVYSYTFLLAKSATQKTLPLEHACAYWDVVFNSPISAVKWTGADSPWSEWWAEFLTSEWKRAINKDHWNQTLKFAQLTLEDESLSFWNEDASWPSIIDEFVEWVKKEKRGGGETAEVMEE